MGMLEGDKTVSLTLNAGHLYSLFTMTLNYDCQIISDYLRRVKFPLTYVIPFEEYIRFINIETTGRTDKATFLSSDKVLKECTRKILPLIKSLEEVRKKQSVGATIDNSFDAIPDFTLDALNKIYTNFLLNCAVIQAKLVEFIRWDMNRGDFVPRIVPDLGVFSVLTNMDKISIVSDDEEYKGLEYETLKGVSSNLEVGTFDLNTLKEVPDCVYPDMQLDSYLYRGVYKWTPPKGYYVEERERDLLNEKIKRVRKIETSKKRLEDEIRKMTHKYTLNHEEYLIGLRERTMTQGSTYEKYEDVIIELMKRIHTLDARGIPVDRGTQNSLNDWVKHFTIDQDEYLSKLPTLLQDSDHKTMEDEIEIINLVKELDELKQGEQLTPKEQELRELFVKLKQKSSYKDRYPVYAYEELITKLDKKINSGEELSALEEDVLSTEDWVMVLLSLIQLIDEQGDISEETYLIGPRVITEDTEHESTTVKAEAYNLLSIE